MHMTRPAATLATWSALVALALGCGAATMPSGADASKEGEDAEQSSEVGDGDGDSLDYEDLAVSDADGDIDPAHGASGVETADAAVPLDMNGEPCNGLRKKDCPCTKSDEECCYYNATALGLSCSGVEGCHAGVDCTKLPRYWEEVWECRCWAYNPPETWSDKCHIELKKNWCDEDYGCFESPSHPPGNSTKPTPRSWSSRSTQQRLRIRTDGAEAPCPPGLEHRAAAVRAAGWTAMARRA